MLPIIDERAKRILFDTFWTSIGWRSIAQTSAEDFGYAKSKGLMFDPVSLSHDEVVKWPVDARNAVEPATVVSAFIASLGSRRLDLRSALGCYAVARHIKDHTFAKQPGGYTCRVCGAYKGQSEINLNVLNFERLKWGGVRHSHPEYIAFDLRQLSIIEVAQPTEADLSILIEILDTARSMPASARLKDLSKALAPILPSNDSERRTLIGILGYCGILTDPTKQDFRTSFAAFEERERTKNAKDDWPYPVQWWNGQYGVNEDAVIDWFQTVTR